MYNLLSTFPQNIHVWILDIKIGFASKNNQWTNGQWKMWNLTSDMVLMWSGHSFWPASEWYLQGAGVRVEKKSGIRGQVEFWDFVFSFFFQYGLGWNTVPKELFRISQLKQSHLWILGVFFQKKMTPLEKQIPLGRTWISCWLGHHFGCCDLVPAEWFPVCCYGSWARFRQEDVDFQQNLGFLLWWKDGSWFGNFAKSFALLVATNLKRMPEMKLRTNHI